VDRRNEYEKSKSRSINKIVMMYLYIFSITPYIIIAILLYLKHKKDIANIEMEREINNFNK